MAAVLTTTTPARPRRCPEAKERSVNDTELDGIEERLGVKLPGHYRAFVRDYPAALREARYEYNGRSAAESFLFDDPEPIVEHNRDVREPGLLITDSETGPWPDEYLIIGKDVGGNYWCVTLTGPSKAVWFFDHEEGVFRRESKSLEEHAGYALQSIKE